MLREDSSAASSSAAASWGSWRDHRFLHCESILARCTTAVNRIQVLLNMNFINLLFIYLFRDRGLCQICHSKRLSDKVSKWKQVATTELLNTGPDWSHKAIPILYTVPEMHYFWQWRDLVGVSLAFTVLISSLTFGLLYLQHQLISIINLTNLVDNSSRILMSLHCL